MRAAALALLLAAPAAAQEFVPFEAPPGDDAFYRAVACAAPPGGPCAKPVLRWPAARRDPLTVGLVTVTPMLAGEGQRRFDAALDAALAEIASVGADLRLARDDADPDIAIHVVPTPPDHVIDGTGIAGLDGAHLQLGRVALVSRGGTITRGLIAVSAFARPSEIGPVLLEEVTQALGLMTDLRGPGLEASVFGEDTNAARRLSPQDAMAIRRHYPPRPEEG